MRNAMLVTSVSANLVLVENDVQIVRNYGAEPAPPDDIRQALGAVSDGG
jgi:uncharacterized protein (DUF849 family)